MVEVAGSSNNQRDTVVLAFNDEALADDRLTLVVRHLLAGTVETTAVRCLPGCTPNVLCALLGFQHVCDGDYQAGVYFRNNEIIREFHGYDRIGLPVAAHVQLQRVPNSMCEDDLPVQRPLREHQHLILAHDAFDLARTEESSRPVRPAMGQSDGEVLEPDVTQLMQRHWTVHPVDPDLAYVLTSARAVRQQVSVWLHTWDRRHEWAFVHRSHYLSLAHSIKPQILHLWRDHQVRPHAVLVPVRPALNGPIFLLLPVCPES